MWRMWLLGRQPTYIRKSTDRKALILLSRSFDGRITSLYRNCGFQRTNRLKIMLAVVLDLYARQILRWSLSNKPDANRVIEALDMAYEQRGRPQGLPFYSDQGSQGAFNRLSQHLYRGVYGTTRRVDAKIDGPGERCALQARRRFVMISRGLLHDPLLSSRRCTGYRRQHT